MFVQLKTGLQWFKKRVSPLCGFCLEDRDDKGRSLCSRCLDELLPLPRLCCMRCGDPFYEKTEVVHVCARCAAQAPPFETARSIYAYRGMLREKLLAYKYAEELGLESALQELLRDGLCTLWQEGKAADVQAIVPVPPDPKRGRSRGYNPPLRLALGLRRAYRLPLCWRGISRMARLPQTGLSQAERYRNVKGIFSAAPRARQALRGRRVLVVDDVWTTGSTAREFSRFLKGELGVARVDVLTLARR